MINAMEPEEREDPDLIAKSPSRRRRIAKDSEMSEDSVVEMISTFASMRYPLVDHLAMGMWSDLP